MKQLIPCLITLLSLFAISCTKTDNSTPTTGNTSLVKKMAFSSCNNNENLDLDFSYDSKGSLTRVEGSFTEPRVYTGALNITRYDNNLIQSASNSIAHEGNNIQVEYDPITLHYAYSISNRDSTCFNYPSGSDKINSEIIYSRYTYSYPSYSYLQTAKRDFEYDNAGNVTKMTTSYYNNYSWVVDYIYTWTYDKKVNPFQFGSEAIVLETVGNNTEGVSAFLFSAVGANNPLSLTEYTSSNVQTRVFNSKYTYNPSGTPQESESSDSKNISCGISNITFTY